MADYFDCTGDIGSMFPNTQITWPMYSFDQPSYRVWGTIANELHQAGWSEGRIKEWLQSKSARWAIDGTLGDALHNVAKAYAAKIVKEEGS